MTLQKVIRALKGVIIAPTCPICGRRLTPQESFVCLDCQLAAPYTHLWQSRDNAMEQRFWGIVPIERAAAFLWFTEGSKWREIIHEFKYHSHWFLAEQSAEWFASELLRTDFLEGIDLIVPVPLHWHRRLSRGYNQSEYIAAGISHKTKIPYTFNAVKRIVDNPPQAGAKFLDRWQNIDNIFTVTRPEALEGRHILLVDDVFTSGATLTTLSNAILTACKENVKISVATIAATRHLIEK